ncbi:hypothetical protein QBC44DRAFT_391387 [Cladorrhinum sp. PSN332]|nr:hypothetical protein QBC44DRAFT_391387 [Cladorrhinum sp. PSN332]
MPDKRKKSASSGAPKRQRNSVEAKATHTGTYDEADSDGSSGDHSYPSSGDESNDDGHYADDEPSDNENSDAGSIHGEGANNDQTEQEAAVDQVAISNVLEMFQDIVARVRPPKPRGDRVYRLNVATICSGTDAPIFALNLLIEAIFTSGKGSLFTFDHLFSCEIEPFKQGFIRRNLPHATIIFRDVVEMAAAAHKPQGEVTTAGGAMAKIPTTRLDILFCGCSCVDYSNMNTSKPNGRIEILDAWLKDKNTKDANGKKIIFRYEVKANPAFRRTLVESLEALKTPSIGESTRTFFATINLINEKRPKVVILENVFGAPWEMYQQQIFPLIGYYAKYMRLDSKDYYLPQTRQRGYLFAIDCQSVTLHEAEKIATTWEATMTQCKRQASSTVTDFLKGPDDPATVQARAEMEQTRGQSRNGPKAEWNLSYLRHQTERRAHALDMNDNPVSMKFMRCGRVVSAIFPDHSWQHWLDIQATRIVDLLDIAVASGHAADIFLMHKTSVVDVSQNVDRSNPVQVKSGRAALKGSLGVIGCITPSGCPFVTDLMRPITGTEVMALQGMPVDEMVLSSETQGQLRDLAGNAMTVTVVGAAAYSIIKSVLQVAPRLFEQDAERGGATALNLQRSTDTSRHDPFRNATRGFGLEEKEEHKNVSRTVKQMARRCHCPPGGLAEGVGNDYVLCHLCGSLACKACCGNPEHEFRAAEFANCPAISAEEGKASLKQMLPASLSLAFMISRGDITNIGTGPYREAVQDILTRKQIYYFSEIKVTEVVTIIYKANMSVAHLIMSPATTDVLWYIYMAPNHPSRNALAREEGCAFNIRQPIARGKGGLDNLRHPGKNNRYSELRRETEGIYEHRPLCGTAGNQLHAKYSGDKPPKVFLFRECSRLGECRLDTFIWSETMKRLEPHEHRGVLLHLEAGKQPGVLKEGTPSKVKVHVEGYWANSILSCSECLASSPSLLNWGWMKGLKEVGCPGNAQDHYDPSLSHYVEVTANIGEFPLSSTIRYRLQNCSEGYLRIPPPQRDAFLNHVSFAFLRFGRAFPTRLFAMEDPIPIKRCDHCAVAPPAVVILMRDDPTKKKAARKEAFEDPDEAARFERQLQELPRAVIVDAALGGDQLVVRISLAPKALPSRAFAHLFMAHRSVTRGRLDMNDKALTTFRVELNYANPTNLYFSCLYGEIRSCSSSTTGITPPESPDWFPVEVNPSRFKKQEEEPRKKRGRSENKAVKLLKLRKDQEEAVEWMIRRELSSTSFVEAEFEEEVIRPLNMRAVGKATWATRFPYSSRGGVCAHDIGYGKTVITLGLIDCQYRHDRTNLLQERMTLVDDAWREELSPHFDSMQSNRRYLRLRPGAFFHHLEATLVIVPDHICTQWKDEVGTFLGIQPPKVVVIKAVPQLHEKCNLGALKKAEIIIVSAKAFGSAPFLERLDRVSGRPDVVKGLSGRHLDIWYRQAMSNIRLLTAYYIAGIAAGVGEDELLRRITRHLIPGIISKTSQELNALEQKIVPPSSRGQYKGKIPAQTKTAADGKTKATTRQPKVHDAWAPSWLHNCSFARIVWDECSYESKNVALFVENAVSNSKWLLSGTPLVFGLEQVCKTAKMFGIHVARPEPRLMPGLPPITKGPEWDIRSKSEDFHRFSSPVKTASLALDRHNQAVQFVREFYRANQLPSHGFDCEEYVLPVPMAPLTSARYQLVAQEVEDMGGDFSALPAHSRHEVRLNNSQHAREKADPGYLARMLLGQLACGLGRKLAERFAFADPATPPPEDYNAESLDTLIDFAEALRQDKETHGQHLKFFWDKAMWLARWIESVEWTAKTQLSPVTTLILRMCEEMQKAAETDNFDLFGDRDCLYSEAAVILAQSLGTVGNALRGQWIDNFHRARSIFTWVDFFHLDGNLLDGMSEKQLYFLVEDLCYFRRKFIPIVQRPASDDPRETSIIKEVLAADLRRRTQVLLPNTPALVIGAQEDLEWIKSNWSLADLRKYIKWWLTLKPAKPNWDNDKNSFTGEIPGYNRLSPRDKKQAVLSRLNQGNLKCSPATRVDKLLELLWQHQNGVAEPKFYRDGRGIPDRHHDFKKATAPASPPSDQQGATADAMKAAMSPLSKVLEDYRIAMREYRYVSGFERLVPKNAQVKTRMSCSKCKSAFANFGEEVYLVVACGHVLCSKCRYHKSSGCPVANCPASTRGRPVLRSSYIQRQLDSAPSFDKIQFVMDQIQHIRVHFPDDKILVFAQYKGVIDALWSEIRRVDPHAINLTSTGRDASAQVTLFQKDNHLGRILLMDIDTESSAGTNLFCANHIVLANPFCHADKSHQARTVLQARGRCLRQGQKKKVFIYHFMVPNTIEEVTMRELGDSKLHPDIARYFLQQHEHVPWWMDKNAKDASPPDKTQPVFRRQSQDPMWRGELFERDSLYD